MRPEVGKTYIRRAIPTSPLGQKGVLEKIIGDGHVVELRDPHTGFLFTAATRDLEGPVEPDPTPEVCPICRNTREVPHMEPTDKPWVSVVVGTDPCPACSTGTW